ncbi:MAG TPA: TIGR04255 family protein [Anaerolineales bacterium]|nr:TIGR04255 family protein [Anaerolineales bacterium]
MNGYVYNSLAMAEKVHLKNAPITEAIIDFRIKPAIEIPPNKLSEIEEKIGKAYPTRERRDLFEGKMEFVPSQRRLSQTAHDKGLYGFFFKSADGKNIAQFRVDGFTFNRLKPYTSWSKIFNEATRLWKLYKNLLIPQSVSRIAVRYINHLEFPSPVIELSKYLTVPPQVPDKIPNKISKFLSQVVVVDEESGIISNITQASEPGTNLQKAIIILDIDVFKACDLDPDNLEIQKIFKNLREKKNLIFFEHITQETVELYK